jgi:hypothetical protein
LPFVTTQLHVDRVYLITSLNGAVEESLLLQTMGGAVRMSTTLCEGEETKKAALQALTTQLEQLLWLAHKMQLVPLIASLQTFIFNNTAVQEGILRGWLGKVFTPRVQEAALGPGRTTGAQEWTNSILAQPAAVYTNSACDSRSYEHWLLEPCGGCRPPAGCVLQGAPEASYPGIACWG